MMNHINRQHKNWHFIRIALSQRGRLKKLKTIAVSQFQTLVGYAGIKKLT